MDKCAHLPYASEPFSLGPDHDELLTHGTKKGTVTSTLSSLLLPLLFLRARRRHRQRRRWMLLAYKAKRPLQVTSASNVDVSVEDALNTLNSHNFEGHFPSTLGQSPRRRHNECDQWRRGISWDFQGPSTMSGVIIVLWICQVQMSKDDVKAIYVPSSIMDVV